VERSGTRPGTERKEAKLHVASPLGPGSRARIDTVRKLGAEARAWPGHEKVVGMTRLFARSAGTERVAA
jgi:hypothetical protein